MEAGEIFISNRNGNYRIRVVGRATFQCAPPLRNLAQSLENETFSGISVDLSKCVWMDSTFMGILAMLGLRSKRISVPMEILNASEQNKSLLFGLGLKKLFQFADRMEEKPDEDETAAAGTVSMIPHAETVLEAHKTLMGVDEQNVKKFERVVSMVQQDIDRRNEEKK